MANHNIRLWLITLVAALGCEDSNNSQGIELTGDWLIPVDEIRNGVFGLLYNSNLEAFDRDTDSYCS